MSYFQKKKSNFKSKGDRERSFDKSSDKPFRKSFDKPYDKPRTQREGDREPSFDKSQDKPFRKSFDKPYDKPRTQREGDREPFRKSYDKPYDKPRTQREGDREPFRKSYDKPYDKPRTQREGDREPFRKSYDKPYDKPRTQREDDRKPFFDKSEDKPFRKPYDKPRTQREGDREPFFDKSEDKPFRKPYDKPRTQREDDRKPFFDKSEDKPFRKPYDKPRTQREGDREYKSRDRQEDAPDETQLIYGRHPVIEALEQGIVLEKILFQQGLRGEFEKEVRHICREMEVPLQIVPKERLDFITRKNHQGIIGYRSPIEYQELEDVLESVLQRGELPLFVLLDGVTDVRNVGAIARSAEVAGAQALVVPLRGVAAINDEAFKTSAGALNTLPVCRVKNLQVALDFLKEHGIQTIAAEMRGTKSLDEVDFSKPTAILMGAEGRGIAPELLKKVDVAFHIPMRGKTNSFNVSVATGIVLYESLRQRGV